MCHQAVEHCDERLTEEQLQSMVDAVATHLAPPPAEVAAEAPADNTAEAMDEG